MRVETNKISPTLAVRKETRFVWPTRKQSSSESTCIHPFSGKKVCPWILFQTRCTHRDLQPEQTLPIKAQRAQVVSLSKRTAVCFRKRYGQMTHREELKVAVPNGVHQIKAQQVHIKHRDACAPTQPGTKQRNRKICCVHKVLHERMH